MLKAVSLLRDPNTKVISVAEECGYNHLSLFNIMFKKRFGVTPSEWRKRSLLAESESVNPRKEVSLEKLANSFSSSNKLSKDSLLQKVNGNYLKSDIANIHANFPREKSVPARGA